VRAVVERDLLERRPTIDDPSAFVATGTFASSRSSPASTVGSQATDRTVYP
jgi:hypothetical protein